MALQLYEEGAILDEVAEILGSSRRHCRKAILEMGGKIRPKAFEKGGLSGNRNHRWNGGRNYDDDGYILVWMPDHPRSTKAGYIREHRLVMEEMLGRLLEQQEVVHHKNGKKDDNRPENLEVFPTNGEHLRHELQGRCPNWSQEGRRKILEAVRKPRKQKSKKNHPKNDDPS